MAANQRRLLAANTTSQDSQSPPREPEFTSPGPPGPSWASACAASAASEQRPTPAELTRYFLTTPGDQTRSASVGADCLSVNPQIRRSTSTNQCVALAGGGEGLTGQLVADVWRGHHAGGDDHVHADSFDGGGEMRVDGVDDQGASDFGVQPGHADH